MTQTKLESIIYRNAINYCKLLLTTAENEIQSELPSVSSRVSKPQRSTMNYSPAVRRSLCYVTQCGRIPKAVHRVKNTNIQRLFVSDSVSMILSQLKNYCNGELRSGLQGLRTETGVDEKAISRQGAPLGNRHLGPGGDNGFADLYV